VNTQQRKTEIAELKEELHSQVRARVEHMTPDQRARYRAQLGAEERRAFDIIMRGTPANTEAVTAERAAMRAEMDRRMGLVTTTGGVTRTAIQLTASVLGAPASAAPGGALQRRAPAPQRPTAQHQPPAKTAEQLEMDRRMGLSGGGCRITRTAHSLTFSMASD
jgi:hypothetical protein